MSFGEYKQLIERVAAGWKRGDHAAVLADAERAYALETGELVAHGYGHAAWGLISVHTGLRRFEDARRIFAEVVDAKALFAERFKRDAATAEKIVIAGSCIAWESGDFAAQAKTMRRAFDRRAPDSADLAYAFACFFARVRDSRAWQALHAALANGTQLASVLADSDLVSLHADRRWDDIVARDRPWQIDSRPPGAQILLDGVDTAERQRMAEDAAREPDDAQRAKTRAHVGDVQRARITLTRHTTYGLGGLTIEVRGDGHVVLDRGTFMPTDTPLHHEVRTETVSLFEAFIAAAFTELVIANQPGVPDELYLDLVLAGHGGICKHGKFASKPHARFDALVQAVRELAIRAVEPSLHRALSLA